MSENKIVEVLERIEKSLQKQESDMIISSKNNDITVHFDNPIYAKNAKIALKLFSMYYSIPNISEENNLFIFKHGKKAAWVEVALDPGSYEISSMSDRIRELVEQNDPILNEIAPSEAVQKRRILQKPTIKFRADPATMKCIMDIPENFEVDFEPLRAIGSMLGFFPKIYTAGTHISDYIVNINPVNSLLLHCNIADGCSINGKPSRCIYSFDPKVAPGYKITEEPRHLIFYPIDNLDYLSKIRIWLTDDEGKKVDTRDEKLTIVMTIRV